jgi:hypothetical protein
MVDKRQPTSDKQIGSRGLSVLQWSVAAIWGLPLLLCCCIGWNAAYNYIKYAANHCKWDCDGCQRLVLCCVCANLWKQWTRFLQVGACRCWWWAQLGMYYIHPVVFLPWLCYHLRYSIPYMALMPMYIGLLTAFALARLDDFSWYVALHGCCGWLLATDQGIGRQWQLAASLAGVAGVPLLAGATETRSCLRLHFVQVCIIWE